MELKTARLAGELSKVMMKPSPEIQASQQAVYWVFSDIATKAGKWQNMTVISPINLGEEFPKTYGHYHSTNQNETYKLIEGNGILLMQERPNPQEPHKLKRVFLIKMEAGEELVITPEWGHSWTNIGNTPLVTFDNWTWGHSPSDYEPITDAQGMAVYITKLKDTIKFIKNPKYQLNSELQIVSLSGFKQEVQL